MRADTLHVRSAVSSCQAKLRLGLAIFCIGWMAAAPAAAQEADSVNTPPRGEADSLRTAFPPAEDAAPAIGAATSETAPRRPARPVGFGEYSYGEAIADTLPVRLTAIDLSDLLGDVPGAFLYRFTTPGWPDGWSRDGLPPQRSTLSLNAYPFTHVFTGRAGFDIAPVAFIEPPRLFAQYFDRPAAVSMRTRPFANPRPMTEMKYWKGGDGLESIDAVHAQHRQVPVLGRPGFLNVMGSYSGRGADGEYPGSDLHRGRQVQLRIRYEQPGWSAELHEMHTRRSVGAHGGVIPDETGFESVYQRVGARVEDPAARRRLIRNDVAATLRLRLFGKATSLGAFWTAESFRYRDVADTAGTASDRVGIRVRQPLPGGLAAELTAWTDGVEPRYRFDSETLRRSELHAALRDSLSFFGWTAAAAAGVHAYDGAIHAGGAIELSRDAGPFGLHAGASLSGEPYSPVEHMGFLALGAAASDPLGRIAEANAGLAWRGGPFNVSLRAFGSRTTHPRDIYMETDYLAVPDSAAVRTAASAMLRVGGSLEFGWRRDAERGFYGFVQPSAVRLVNQGESELHARAGRALPQLFGRARLGARYVLFRGDLDLDAFIGAYAWSATTGRAFHPETGLLAVPASGAMSFGPSSIINIGTEAGVRDATLFVMFENVLSGTALMTGNLIVPVYPLPAQRLRFGVYWPIFD